MLDNIFSDVVWLSTGATNFIKQSTREKMGGENTNTWLFFVNLCSTITYYKKIYLHMPSISVLDP